MTRTYAKNIDETVKINLNLLKERTTSVEQYQDAMIVLGKSLARNLFDSFSFSLQQPVTVVVTAEDADFLGRGFINEMESLLKSKIYMVCFWNDHRQEPNTKKSIAPVINEYLQPGYENSTQIIVLKSIISGSCVVKSNILSLYGRMENLSKIYIAAPVVLEDYEIRLKNDFPDNFADKFEFAWFAQDKTKNKSGEVEPGIGGLIYERLGLNGNPLEIKYFPDSVKNRLLNIGEFKS